VPGTISLIESSINVHEKPLHEISPVAQSYGKMECWKGGIM